MTHSVLFLLVQKGQIGHLMPPPWYSSVFNYKSRQWKELAPKGHKWSWIRRIKRNRFSYILCWWDYFAAAECTALLYSHSGPWWSKHWKKVRKVDDFIIHGPGNLLPGRVIQKKRHIGEALQVREQKLQCNEGGKDGVGSVIEESWRYFYYLAETNWNVKCM